MNKRFFTSESVTEGHPDKLCDYISDTLLDRYLEQDMYSRVAIETFASRDSIVVAGEVTSTATVDIEKIVRECIKEIGYDDAETGMDYRTCDIYININKQSSDIAMGVDRALETKNGEGIESEGAGDQGMMFGFASNETEEYMPLAISLAHKLARKLVETRKLDGLTYLRPDGKTQITVEYQDNVAVRVDTVVLSTQHDATININKLREDVKEKIIKEVIPSNLIDENTKYYINPTGRFVVGGPMGDTGLTGRKIIVDTYGGYAPHGGGAFSGKDPTKVDRSAAYMARHIARNIVSNKLADKCQIEVSYAIGMANPISICVETFGTSKYSEEELVQIVLNNFDLTPRGIINYLELRKPIYRLTTNYGHFGRESFSWEKEIKLKI